MSKPYAILISIAALLCSGLSQAKLPSADREDPYAIKALKRYPYVCGSLQYLSDNASLSHLTVGATIPIRFGKLARHAIPVIHLPPEVLSNASYTGQTFYEYEDNKALTRYGYFTVTEISTSSISFFYKVLDLNGATLASGTKTLGLNAATDLDEDGNQDVQYKVQINPSRRLVSTQRFLTFLTNESSLYTTTYCYLPGNLPNLGYAGGNMGYNLAGFAVIKPGRRGVCWRKRLSPREPRWKPGIS